MSLSFWIRDYLFIPLATLRRETWWRNVALMLSMVIFGLWHKISFLFFIWGTYQGSLLILQRRWQRLMRSFEPWPDRPERICGLVGYIRLNKSWLDSVSSQ